MFFLQGDNDIAAFRKQAGKKYTLKRIFKKFIIFYLMDMTTKII